MGKQVLRTYEYTEGVNKIKPSVPYIVVNHYRVDQTSYAASPMIARPGDLVLLPQESIRLHNSSSALSSYVYEYDELDHTQFRTDELKFTTGVLTAGQKYYITLLLHYDN